MKHAQQVRLLKFAIEHDYIITPVGWKKHIEAYDKLGHCPCEYTRPECPCPESHTDIKQAGHCKCSLFYKDYPTYLKICHPDS